MKVIDNVTTMKANATKYSLYTFQINQQQHAWGRDKYDNAHIQVIAIEISRRVRQSRREAVVIQSVLCEVAVWNSSLYKFNE